MTKKDFAFRVGVWMFMVGSAAVCAVIGWLIFQAWATHFILGLVLTGVVLAMVGAVLVNVSDEL